MAIEAGKYHPIPAKVYSRTTVRTGGEPVQTLATTPYCQVFIRFPWMARYGFEQPNQKQQTSYGQIIIRMRRNTKTILIVPEMEIHHNGSVYGIVSPQPIMDQDELEFLCQYRTTSEVTLS